jgi:hypothetical protein
MTTVLKRGRFVFRDLRLGRPSSRFAPPVSFSPREMRPARSEVGPWVASNPHSLDKVIDYSTRPG